MFKVQESLQEENENIKTNQYIEEEFVFFWCLIGYSFR